MSDTPIRRSNWMSNPQGDADDPLAELERIVGRSPPPKPAASAPQTGNELPSNDFLGFSEKDFETAFRSLEKQAPPVREGAVFRKEPLFDETPAPQADYSRNFAQTFEEEIASAGKSQPEREFETRTDVFDFDRRALGSTFEPTLPEEPEPAYYLESRPRSGFVTVIGVTGLVFVAVIGALVYSWVGTRDTADPITITADQSPVKKIAAADTEQPSQNKLIYDRLGSDENAGNETLVSREEQPVDELNARQADEAPPPSEEASASDTPRAPDTPRVILPNASAQSASPAPETPTATLNAPRQVATTTIRVRPDGTMENIPAPASASTSAAEAPTAVRPNIVPAPASRAAASTPPSPVTEPEETTASAESAPVRPSAPAAAPAAPARRETPARPAPQRVANLPAPTATPRAASSSTSSGGGFVVQVSSQKSEDSARASFNSMQARFPQVLASYQPSIKAVSLGDKGTFYRVRVGPMASRDEAAALCGRLKAAGGDCVVTPN